MTSDKGGTLGRNPDNDPKKPSARRPAPTIDLKATEVASEPAAEKTGAHDASAEAAASQPTAKPEEPRLKTEAGDLPPPPQGSGQSKRPIWTQLSGGQSLPLIGIAVAAAAIVFFLLGLVTANLFAEREVAAQPRAVNDLTERLAKIETALSAQRTPDTALIGRIAAAEAAAKLATENAAAQQRRAEELTALVREAHSRADAAVASAEATQKGVGATATEGARIDVSALTQRIAALEQAFKTNEAELARRRADAADERKTRVAVVASVLLGAVERGTPFTAELAAAKALAPDAKTLAPLEAFATTGVPGAADLSRALSAQVPSMLKVAESETPRDGGFLDKLQTSAERLVRIRPVGEVTGDRPMDVIARIEAKAGAFDLAGALAELSKLPPQVRAPADDWIKRANARNAALAAARQFSTGALAVIGKPNT